MKLPTITLRKAKDVFPDKYTKVRSHDLISKSIDKKKFLTLNEQKKLHNIASNIRTGIFGNKVPNQDIIAIRTGKKIKFDTLYDEK